MKLNGKIAMERIIPMLLVVVMIIGTHTGCQQPNQIPIIPTDNSYAPTTEDVIVQSETTEPSTLESIDKNVVMVEGERNHYAEVHDLADEVNIVTEDGHTYYDTEFYRKDNFSIAELDLFRRDGIYFTECIDPPEMNQGSHYAIHTLTQDGHIEFENTTFSKEVTVLNNSIHVEFTYAETDTSAILTHIYPTYKNELPRLNYVLNSSPDIHNILVVFACVTEEGNEVLVPAYLDLETGEVFEFLYGGNVGDYTDLEVKYGFTGCDISKSNNVVFRHTYGKWYFSSAQDECVYDLEEIVGTTIFDCILLEDAIICWNEDGDFWRVDTEKISVTQIFEDLDLQFYSGIDAGTPCSFMIYKDGFDYLHVYDFLDNTDILLTYLGTHEFSDGRCQPSPDGRKFLLSYKENDGYQFAVYNCDTDTFTDFVRDGLDGEDSIEWVRANQIMILASGSRELSLYTVN